MMKRYNRKLRPRLAGHDYFDPTRLYFITICDHRTLSARIPPQMDPQQPFLFRPLALLITEALQFRQQRGDWRLCCYCLMPDHLHLVASPLAKPITELTAEFESYTTNAAWGLGVTGKLWQRSFHDRVVRGDPSAVIAYVLNNPVKAGLVSDWRDWPWSYVAPWCGAG